jgi:hypothetical protein
MLRLLLAVSVVALFTGCPKPCERTADCDDGLYCNGPETCEAGHCVNGAPPACDDGLACTTDVCSEDLRHCINRTVDTDGDGHGDATCLDPRGVPLGDDCDDRDVNRFPGNREVCDPTHDEDCDDATLGRQDSDNDGYISSTCGNTLLDGGVLHGPDCDDSNQGVHPGQLEACNGRDDNCDTKVDEGVTVTRYADRDGDGYGAGAGLVGCPTDPNTSERNTDCDDANPAMHPGQFSCVNSFQYQLCQLDGGYLTGTCSTQRCASQPNGLGLCL